MIEAILPETVVAVAAHEHVDDVALFPAEAAAIEDAVAERRGEFITARACARRALERLGLPPHPIVPGPRGAPGWPDGIVGSITHCDGYTACALARSANWTALGIDAEPNAPLPDGVLNEVGRSEERRALRDLSDAAGGIPWDRLLFSAKESIYKCWFPLTRGWLGFEDAVVTFDPDLETFTARLLVPTPSEGERRLRELAGRWIVTDDLVATAIAVPADEPLP